MGMFDSVHVRCPHCSAVVKIQTKAGKCLLKNYGQSSVPVEIAVALTEYTKENPEHCTECNEPFKITTPAPKRVVLDTHKWEPDEDDYD